EQNTQKSTRAFSVFPIIIVIFLVIGIIFFAWYLTQVSGNDNNEPVNDNNNNNDEIYLNSDEESNNDSEEQGNNNEDNGENATNDEDADDSNNDEDDDSEPEFSVVNEGSGNSPESELDFKYDGDEVTLELESDDATWLDVKTDSESLYSSNLTPDESPVELDVSDEDNVSLNIGNAPSLKVSINGVEMEYPVDQQIVHQKIKINLINENE